MKLLIFKFVLLAYFYVNNAASEKEDVGKPLFLNEYVEKGLIDEGQKAALVRYPDFQDVKSYSGFFQTDHRYNSNLFFWFFLSKSNPTEDPLLLWVDGGPGSSSMCAVFNYHGPYYITKNQTVCRRNDTLTNNHNVIYLDSPVGTGFSGTSDAMGYARKESDIDRGVVVFLSLFFQLFPKFRSNDFYVIGDSYSGKYCVTIPLAVQRYNRKAADELRINLKGVAFGNGLIDVKAQMRAAEFLYQTGFLDAHQRDQLKASEDETANEPNKTSIKYKMLIGMGITYFENILKISKPEDHVYYENYIVMPRVRKALHVGDRQFDRMNLTVRAYIDDLYKPETEALIQVLENFNVLIYNGNLDMYAPYSSSEELYRSLNWSRAEEYRKAERKLWTVDGDLAGFWKTAGNMQEVLVRNAGHVASYEQPHWYCHMMTRFTRNDIPK